MTSRQLLISPEHLVGLGFRCSLTSLRPSLDTAPRGLRLLASTIANYGLPSSLRTGFTSWAIAIDSSAERPIAVYPLENIGFSADERLAIALIAACQHPRCPALTICASALIGSADLGRVLAATQIIAHTLSSTGAVLQPLTGIDPLTSSPPRLH